MFYCGNQWGYTPLGNNVDIPQDHCDAPQSPNASINGQYITFSWVAPHDVLYYALRYKLTTDTLYTEVNVFGQSTTLELLPNKCYQWDVRSICNTAPLKESASVTKAPGFICTGDALHACGIPGNVHIVNNATYYRVLWDAVSFAIYYIIRVWPDNIQNPLIAEYKTQDLQFDIKNVLSGNTYNVEITAVCNGGKMSAPIVKFTAGRLDCPPPQKINTVVSYNSIVAAWLPPSEIMDLTYNVYLNGTLVAANYPGTTFSFSQLTQDTSYLIEIRTNCVDGFSVPLATTVKTPAGLCPSPTNVTVTNITTNTFRLNWDANLSSTGHYEVSINNGVPQSLPYTANFFDFTNLPSGGLIAASVRAVCGLPISAPSEPVTRIVQLIGCQSPTNLLLVPNVNKITASWSLVPNALRYNVRVLKHSDNSVVKDLQVSTTIFEITGLAAATQYDISVVAVCSGNGSTEITSTVLGGTSTTLAIPACENAIIDTLTSTQDTISLTYHFASGRTNGFITVKTVKTSDSTVFVVQTFTTVQPVVLTGLVAGTQYNIFIYHNNGNCTPTLIQTTTLPGTCRPPAIISAVLSSSDTVLTVAYTNSPDTPPNYSLDYMYVDDAGATWINWSNVITASPVVVTGLLKKKIKARMRSNCPSSVKSNYVESLIACPTPVNIKIAVTNNTVQLIWDPISNVSEYSVEITSLVNGLRTYSTASNSITVDDLPYSSIFLVVVKAICQKGPDIIATSQQYMFQTGPHLQVDNGSCKLPIFTAFAQACIDSDPIGDGGGGGGNPLSTCTVNHIDWATVSSLFLPVSNDPPNDTRIEAIFNLPQNAPAGTSLTIPGGIMGQATAGCRPTTNTSMVLEILHGGTLSVGSGSFNTDGNITGTGSYTSDGQSTLIVRIKGNYIKA
jgi:hypothetical protein